MCARCDARPSADRRNDRRTQDSGGVPRSSPTSPAPPEGSPSPTAASWCRWRRLTGPLWRGQFGPGRQVAVAGVDHLGARARLRSAFILARSLTQPRCVPILRAVPDPLGGPARLASRQFALPVGAHGHPRALAGRAESRRALVSPCRSWLRSAGKLLAFAGEPPGSRASRSARARPRGNEAVPAWRPGMTVSIHPDGEPAKWPTAGRESGPVPVRHQHC